jgi:hypothetical protein
VLIFILSFIVLILIYLNTNKLLYIKVRELEIVRECFSNS